MTPTWAVIFVGITSGALASLVTAVLTVSHERAAEFRSRMLNAADEFSTAAIAALQQTRDAAGVVLEDKTGLVDDTGSFRPEIKTQLDGANEAVDDVFAKEARVHLLFADQSPASTAAAGATACLRNMLMALEHRADSIRNQAALLTYSRNFTGTQEQHQNFNIAALVAIEQTWWERYRERRNRRESVQEQA